MRKLLWNIGENPVGILRKVCGVVGGFSASNIFKTKAVENFDSFSIILRSFSGAVVDTFISVGDGFSIYSTAPIKVTTKECLFSYKLIEGIS